MANKKNNNIFSSKLSEVDKKIIELENQKAILIADKNKILLEKKEFENNNRTKEQKELEQIRENIKLNINKYNELAKSSRIDTGLALLTNGGHLVYVLNDENENSTGEYFYGYSESVNKYPEYEPWYPSSIQC